VNYTPGCFWWDEENGNFSSDGCVVNVNETTDALVVCECTHLTQFNLQGVKDRWEGITRLDELGKDDIIPTINELDTQDFKNLTWDNLMEHPVPLLTLVITLAVFFAMIPLVRRVDARRKDRYIREAMYIPDGTFKASTIGFVELSMEELLGQKEQTLPLEACGGWRDCLWSTSKRLKQSNCTITITAKPVSIPFEGLIAHDSVTEKINLRFSCANIPKMDWFSHSDPVVGILLRNEEGEWEPFTRTEMKINEPNPTFERMCVLDKPSQKPLAELHVRIVLYNDDGNKGDIEKVDQDNKLFFSGKYEPEHGCVRWKRISMSEFLEGHHWLSILSSSGGSPFTGFERLITILIGDMTAFAVTAIFFGAAHESDPLGDLVVTVWASIMVLPVWILFAFLYSRSGPRCPVDEEVAQKLKYLKPNQIQPEEGASVGSHESKDAFVKPAVNGQIVTLANIRHLSRIRKDSVKLLERNEVMSPSGPDGEAASSQVRRTVAWRWKATYLPKIELTAWTHMRRQHFARKRQSQYSVDSEKGVDMPRWSLPIPGVLLEVIVLVLF
jgi:hypothetical protein